MINLPTNSGPILPHFKVTVTQTLLDRPLTGSSYSATYPITRMPFYLYGSSSSPTPEYHIDHALLRGSNIQLSASNITLHVAIDSASTPLLLTLDTIREKVLQPFPECNAILTSRPAFFFTKGKTLDVSVWRDSVDRTEIDGNKILEAWEALDEQQLLGKGKVTLGESVWVDSEALNRDPDKAIDNEDAWKKEFEKYLSDIGQR